MRNLIQSIKINQGKTILQKSQNLETRVKNKELSHDKEIREGKGETKPRRSIDKWNNISSYVERKKKKKNPTKYNPSYTHD